MMDLKDVFIGTNTRQKFLMVMTVKNITELFDSNYQGVHRLFVFAYDDRIKDDNTDANSRVKVDSHKRHFLPGVNIENYIIEIDSRDFYDQPNN